MSIRQFDEYGLKQINNYFNQLKRENEILKKRVDSLGGETTTVKKNDLTLVEQIIGGSDQSYGEQDVQKDNILGYVDDDGNIDLYTDGQGEESNIGIPPTGRVHLTLAGQAIPSSYFLDLRSHNNTAAIRHITADWIVLHDNSSPWKTIALPSCDVINTVTTDGPIANGQDFAGAFNGWMHFYVIYNPSTLTIASLSSESATSPTLPSGYNYFVRVGSGYTVGAVISIDVQINDTIWFPSLALNNGDPGAVSTWENLNISLYVPPTAKSVFGTFGITSNPSVKCGMAIASDTSGNNGSYSSFPSGVSDVAGYEPWGATYFSIPLTTAQQISWKASLDEARYGIRILGYVDDL